MQNVAEKPQPSGGDGDSVVFRGTSEKYGELDEEGDRVFESDDGIELEICVITSSGMLCGTWIENLSHCGPGCKAERITGVGRFNEHL